MACDILPVAMFLNSPSFLKHVLGVQKHTVKLQQNSPIQQENKKEYFEPIFFWQNANPRYVTHLLSFASFFRDLTYICRTLVW